MPKNAGKKSGKNDSKAKKKSSSVTREDKSVSDETEKGLFLAQIEYLTVESEKFQKKCEELEKQNQLLISQFSSLRNEKKDITDYLKHSLLEKEEELDRLSERLQNQREAADQNWSTQQLKHDQLMAALQEQIRELQEQNRKLVGNLTDLDEFERQREDLMTNLDHLEKKLERQEEEHRNQIHDLEMKLLLEKKRLGEEMETCTLAMEAKVQHLVDQNLPERARSVLQENAEMKACFSKLSEQFQVLMEENSALRERKHQLSIDVEIQEEMIREMSRMSCLQRKQVQQLQEELKNKHQNLEQLQKEHSQVLAEMEALRAENPAPGSTFKIQQEHHRAGGTSSVSRPTPKPKSTSCRTRAGSSHTSVPHYRKPVSQESSMKQSRSATGFLTSQQLFNKLSWS
uniref:Cilia- and flagella-associated protein 157 n=2 Tax=Nothobranchius kuhntae TaxID=321403 RepID=A0A1A8K3Y0_NOTKU